MSIGPQRSAAYSPLLEVVTKVRKVVVIYMPETHKDLVDSLRRRVQRDVQETISATNLGIRSSGNPVASSGIERGLQMKEG